jgi:protein O-mannosyl-transferase
LKKVRSASRVPKAPPTAPEQVLKTTSYWLPRWHPHGWRILLLWLLVIAAYSNSFQAGLVFDNAPIISEDPRIRLATSENLGSILTGQYWYNNTTSGLYRPFTTFSYLLNYAVLGNGPSPLGYHWVNLALHAVNVSMVYGLGVLIFGDAALALALGALWGLHPLLVESVTNIVGRADLLAGFGVLAGLLCYMRATSMTGPRRLAWLVGLAASQAIGLFSKESAVVLPAIMLIYDLTWPERGVWPRRALAYGVLAVPFVIFFYMRTQSHAHLLVNFPENPLIAAGFWTARLTAIAVIGKFLWLFLWPASLSADYSYIAIPLFGSGVLEDAKALVALAACAGGILLAVRAYRRSKPLCFFLLFFFAALAPTSNLVILIGSIMAERFAYLPAVGLAGCVVAGIAVFGARQRRVAFISSGLVCLLLGARTYARNFDWHDGVTLWTSAIQVSPNAARAHNNLGYEFTRIRGRMPEAVAEYETALRIRPDYPEAHYNLGNAFLQTSRPLDAIDQYQSALRSAPGYIEAHINLGNALLQVPGRRPEAVAEFQAALRIRPNDADAHNNLGNALLQPPARLPEAIAELQAALRIAPDLAEAHNNLGNALMQTPGRLPEAAAEFQAAIRIRPGYAEAHASLGSALLQSGRLEEAIAEYQTATRIEPGLADAHYNLANALLQIPGKLPEAIAEFETVLRITPDPEVRQILERLRAPRRP